MFGLHVQEPISFLITTSPRCTCSAALDAGGVQRLLELQPAVRAGTFDQSGRGAARRARRVLGVLVDVDGDDVEALACEVGAPLVAEQLDDAGQLVLFDQQVGPGAAALACARRTADGGGDTGLEAAIAQGLHLCDRARDGGHDGG